MKYILFILVFAAIIAVSCLQSCVAVYPQARYGYSAYRYNSYPTRYRPTQYRCAPPVYNHFRH